MEPPNDTRLEDHPNFSLMSCSHGSDFRGHHTPVFSIAEKSPMLGWATTFSPTKTMTSSAKWAVQMLQKKIKINLDLLNIGAANKPLCL